MTKNVQNQLARLERQHDHIDGVLGAWANPDSDDGLGHGVTLFVGGLIVTGQIISERAFYDSLVDQMAEAVQRDAPEQVGASSLTELRETLKSSIAEEPPLPDDFEAELTDEQKLAQLESLARYIHLKDARTLHGNGQFIPGEGALWRCKLASVDAWHLGTLNVSAQ